MSEFDDDGQLLDTIYRGVTDEDALDEALGALAGRFGCDGGAFVLLDLQSAGPNLALTHGAWGSDVMARYAEVAAFDPAPRAFALLPHGCASTTDRLFSADFKQADLFWNDFYRPSGFIETLGAALFADKTRFALLGLHRAAARPPFSHEDIADLERLLPHMERVLQLRRRFAAMNARAEGLEGLVDQLDAGVVTLDPAGGVIFTNRAARDVFARRDGIGLDRAGRLVADRTETRARLSALLASVVKGGSGGMMAVPRANGSYALLVAPAPGGVGDWFAAPYGSGRAVVLIHDPDRRPRDAEEVLQAALGLTPGAARLVAALAADQDLKSFSEATGVTIHTARFHLRTALARTQTRTQSELVRVAVRLLRDFTLRRG